MSEVTQASSKQHDNSWICQRRCTPCDTLSKAVSSAWNFCASSCSNCWYRVTYKYKINYIRVIITEENARVRRLRRVRETAEVIQPDDVPVVFRAVQDTRENKEGPAIELRERVVIID